MKLLELSTGNFKLVFENGEIQTFCSLEEMDKIYGINKVFELVMYSDYVNIEGYKPDIFTTKIDGKYRCLYPNGRVEMLYSNKDSVKKFQGHYRKVFDKRSEDFNILHVITFQDGSTDIMSLGESLTKSFVKRKDLLFK
jgi:hypothetical protein